MTRYGYFLSSEEYSPAHLGLRPAVGAAGGAEAFDFLATEVLPRAR